MRMTTSDSLGGIAPVTHKPDPPFRVYCSLISHTPSLAWRESRLSNARIAVAQITRSLGWILCWRCRLSTPESRNLPMCPSNFLFPSKDWIPVRAWVLQKHQPSKNKNEDLSYGHRDLSLLGQATSATEDKNRNTYRTIESPTVKDPRRRLWRYYYIPSPRHSSTSRL